MPENIPNPPSLAEAKANYDNLSPAEYGELGTAWHMDNGVYPKTGAPEGQVSPEIAAKLPELSNDQFTKPTQLADIEAILHPAEAPESGHLTVEQARKKYDLSRLNRIGARDQGIIAMNKAKLAQEQTLRDLIELTKAA